MFDLHIRDVLRLQNIQRWSIVETSRTQSVAEHSYNVAMIADAVFTEMADGEHPHPCKIPRDLKYDTLRYCLCHDLSEIFTGDIPTPVKKWLRGTDRGEALQLFEENVRPSMPYENLTEVCQYIVKFADLLEAVVFIEKYRVDHHGELVHIELREKLAEFMKSINGRSRIATCTLDAMLRVWHDVEHAEYTVWGRDNART